MTAANKQNDSLERKRGRRGSVNNKNRLAAFEKSGPTRGADWLAADDGLVLQVIGLITELGGAVLFGRSRDGGAHSLILMLDDSRETLWFNGDADLDQELRNVVGKLSSMS